MQFLCSQVPAGYFSTSQSKRCIKVAGSIGSQQQLEYFHSWHKLTVTKFWKLKEIFYTLHSIKSVEKSHVSNILHKKNSHYLIIKECNLMVWQQTLRNLGTKTIFIRKSLFLTRNTNPSKLNRLTPLLQ